MIALGIPNVLGVPDFNKRVKRGYYTDQILWI